MSEQACVPAGSPDGGQFGAGGEAGGSVSDAPKNFPRSSDPSVSGMLSKENVKDVKDYQNGGPALEANIVLRRPDRGLEWLKKEQPDAAAAVERLDAAIATSTLDEDVQVARLAASHIASLSDKVGQEYVDDGFVSTTHDHGEAVDKLQAMLYKSAGVTKREAQDKTLYHMKINVPKGTPALKMFPINPKGKYSWQKEILLGRGHKYRVDSYHHDKNVWPEVHTVTVTLVG